MIKKIRYNQRTDKIKNAVRQAIIPAFGVIAVLVVLGSCASKKKGKQGPSAARQAYENMTGYYNAYFNANELLQISYEKLKGSYKENYNEILPVYPMQLADISPVKADLDKAIDKLIKNINGHEVSHWQDDSYVMIGEIQMLKKDYETAEETLEYFMQAFDPLKAKNRASRSTSKSKKKKSRKKKRHRKKSRKKKSKSKSSKKTNQAHSPTTKNTTQASDGFLIWKHTPAYKDGLILLARTYIERGKPTLARSILRRLKEDASLSKEQKAKIGIAQAHLYIRQHQKTKAQGILAETIPMVKSKDDRARYWYILGQLEEESGQCREAINAFEHVIDLRRNYDMEFHALLHKIKCTSGEESKDADKTIRRLKKLMKDDKNEEFIGHIYDAMASVELKRGNMDKAKEYYRNALNSTADKYLKQKVYLHLANYYMERESYLEAKLYLDSTLSVMDKDYPKRGSIEKQRDHLKDIAAQISIIQEKDSLLRISELSEKDQLALAKKLEEKAKASQAAKETANLEQEKNNELQFPGNLQPGRIGLPRGPGGFQLRPNSFFAYNPVLLRKGKTEFKRKWGTRKLEDHWRRSKKDLIQDISENTDSTEVVEEKELTSTDDRNLIRKYLPGIPNSAKQKEEVRKEIELAYYTLGKLYKDKMDNCNKSSKTLEELIVRFPKTTYEAGALYYLYLCSSSEGDNRKAKDYRLTLVQKYPNSLYTKVLEDPDFVKKWLAEQNKEEVFYKQTYALFSAGEYVKAKRQIEAYHTLKDKKNNKYDAKFALLEAMIEGTNGKEAYIKGLKDVIAKYPEAPETIRAKEIMRFLQGDEEAFDQNGKASEGQQFEYKYTPDKMHYALVIIHDLKGNSISKIKIDISQYNRKNHPDLHLKMTSANLDINKDIPLILIRKFKNADEAMKYYRHIQKDLNEFIHTDIHYDLYVASQSNYRNIIHKKSTTSFRPFFEHYYLSQNK